MVWIKAKIKCPNCLFELQKFKNYKYKLQCSNCKKIFLKSEYDFFGYIPNGGMKNGKCK